MMISLCGFFVLFDTYFFYLLDYTESMMENKHLLKMHMKYGHRYRIYVDHCHMLYILYVLIVYM